jgi:ferric-dicitrate binding protein FerR (iron transport regulator)
MTLDCQRWVELADLEAVGEQLPADGPAFLRAHAASCAECAREAAIWRAVRPAQEEAAPGQVEVERILSLAAASPVRGRLIQLPQRWKGALAVSAGVACAAALVLWLSSRVQPEDTASNGGLAKVVESPGQAPAPSQASAQAPAASVPAEPQCTQVVPGATLCLAQGTTITRSVLEGADRDVEIASGRAILSLAPQPAGTSFSLSTAAGKVTAVGTIFSVEVNADGSAVARVIEGHVVARAAKDGIPHSVHAGQALRLGQAQPTQLSAEERELDLALLAVSRPDQRHTTDPSGSAKPGGAGVSKSAPQQDMLEYARSLRASGDFRRAADVYRKIHAANPQSPSGRAALVSLGELLLSLGDAQGALTAFDTYLAGAGALAQEASYGRVRALRALRRPAEEQRAIERFLAAYPDAPQGRVLRSRLAAIQK